jgi:CheY-like chemotaxis protein
VLLDYILNGVNGGEVCHVIKNNPKTAAIPVIIVSGYSKLLFSLGDYGCNAILPKPFGLPELLNAVETWTREQVTA